MSCKENEDDENNGTTDVSFDRSAMLTDYADNLIIPSWETLQTAIGDLSSKIEEFKTETTQSNLDNLRDSWVEVAKKHQYVTAYGFGPGTLLLGSYVTVLGVFPVNEEQVEANVLNTDFVLANTFARDVRGVYALEYLIYGNGQTDADLLAGFDQNRKDYLDKVFTELDSEVDGIVSKWNDSYRTTFIESDGTSAGSSISLLYNEFVKDYENLKNYKLELPGGLSAGQSSAEPELVEAYYSGISKDLIIEHFASCKNIWFGRTVDGTDLIGFEEYLETVEGGSDLVTTTKTAFTGLDSAIDQLPSGRLSDNIESTEVSDLRDALQANTANVKSTMSSLLGISITFNSGDGD